MHISKRFDSLHSALSHSSQPADKTEPRSAPSQPNDPPTNNEASDPTTRQRLFQRPTLGLPKRSGTDPVLNSPQLTQPLRISKTAGPAAIDIDERALFVNQKLDTLFTSNEWYHRYQDANATCASCAHPIDLRWTTPVGAGTALDPRCVLCLIKGTRYPLVEAEYPHIYIPIQSIPSHRGKYVVKGKICSFKGCLKWTILSPQMLDDDFYGQETKRRNPLEIKLEKYLPKKKDADEGDQEVKQLPRFPNVASKTSEREKHCACGAKFGKESGLFEISDDLSGKMGTRTDSVVGATTAKSATTAATSSTARVPPQRPPRPPSYLIPNYLKPAPPRPSRPSVTRIERQVRTSDLIIERPATPPLPPPPLPPPPVPPKSPIRRQPRTHSLSSSVVTKYQDHQPPPPPTLPQSMSQPTGPSPERPLPPLLQSPQATMTADGRPLTPPSAFAWTVEVEKRLQHTTSMARMPYQTVHHQPISSPFFASQPRPALLLNRQAPATSPQLLRRATSDLAKHSAGDDGMLPRPHKRFPSFDEYEEEGSFRESCLPAPLAIRRPQDAFEASPPQHIPEISGARPIHSQTSSPVTFPHGANREEFHTGPLPTFSQWKTATHRPQPAPLPSTHQTSMPLIPTRPQPRPLQHSPSSYFNLPHSTRVPARKPVAHTMPTLPQRRDSKNWRVNGWLDGVDSEVSSLSSDDGYDGDSEGMGRDERVESGDGRVSPLGGWRDV